MTVADVFSQGLRERLGDVLAGLILFGSRARDDARVDSDYDFLVLVHQLNPTVKDAIYDTAGEIFCDLNELIAAVPMLARDFEEGRVDPLLINVRREGVRIL